MRAANVGDQFLYGPASVVNPVTTPGTTSANLPAESALVRLLDRLCTIDGPRDLVAAAPLDRIPLYVRAGSILPLGPSMEWSTQKPADPIELRIYAGADGDFTLYEDENDTYHYEKGAYTEIPLHWDDAHRSSNHRRTPGSFPGMLEHRTFRVVLVADQARSGN